MTSLFEASDAPKAAALERELRACYAENGRFYHTLEHVANLLKLADEYEANLPDSRAVRLAIWFHDAIYNPRHDDNEQQSALLARRNLQALGESPEFVARVESLIASTKTHEAECEDARWFLDFDLSILGASEAQYRNYSQQIRREFAFVEEIRFRAARAKVLQNFLRRETIYFTPELRQKWEENARANLQSEIHTLQSAIA